MVKHLKDSNIKEMVSGNNYIGSPTLFWEEI